LPAAESPTGRRPASAEFFEKNYFVIDFPLRTASSWLANSDKHEYWIFHLEIKKS
jgi:hypothetical protein